MFTIPGEDKPLTDEKFIYIMTRCSFYLLRFGFEEYNDTKDRNFGDFIEAECSEDIKYSLMTLCKYSFFPFISTAASCPVIIFFYYKSILISNYYYSFPLLFIIFLLLDDGYNHY